jgi:hypothetical protein
MMTFLRPYFWCSGKSAISPIAVVQFGFAITRLRADGRGDRLGGVEGGRVTAPSTSG